MSRQLTADDAKQSLNAHAAEKGAEIYQKYGPGIGWNELLQVLEDRTCVRYPCEIVFDSKPLNAGEFAHPVAMGEQPDEGFRVVVHPYFAMRLQEVPYLVLYQLVLVNYGEFASADDAEVFGASALGMNQEAYYRTVCRLADELQENQPF